MITCRWHKTNMLDLVEETVDNVRLRDNIRLGSSNAHELQTQWY